MDPPQTTIFDNQDVLLRLMEFLGPRHVCIGVGQTNHDLHELSQSDMLWRVFWRARCMLPQHGAMLKSSSGDGDCSDIDVHKAAYVFRHAIHEMDLADKLFASTQQKGAAIRNEEEEVVMTNVVDPIAARKAAQQMKRDDCAEELKDEDEQISLYHAYVQKHLSMKLTNLRVEPFGRVLDNDTMQQSNLCSPKCSQTWPGQLSLVANQNQNDEHTNMRNRVTCLNSAETWCDYPTCTQARCGPQGSCLKCYRFLPRDYSLSANGQIMAQRECSERNYDMTSFVKCSWCCVSYCNEHYYIMYQKRNGLKCALPSSAPIDGRSQTPPSNVSFIDNEPWYKCDECNLSSCPDCVSQVFLSPPDMGGCKVVTAGKTCDRVVCNKCIWYVGKKKLDIVQNIPGGDYSRFGNFAEIVTVKGSELLKMDEPTEFSEVESCCARCLRHVEFRWKELVQMTNSFGGFMP